MSRTNQQQPNMAALILGVLMIAVFVWAISKNPDESNRLPVNPDAVVIDQLPDDQPTVDPAAKPVGWVIAVVEKKSIPVDMMVVFQHEWWTSQSNVSASQIDPDSEDAKALIVEAKKMGQEPPFVMSIDEDRYPVKAIPYPTAPTNDDIPAAIQNLEDLLR